MDQPDPRKGPNERDAEKKQEGCGKRDQQQPQKRHDRRLQGIKPAIQDAVPAVAATVQGERLVPGKVAQQPILLRPALVQPSSILQYFFHAIPLDADVDLPGKPPPQDGPQRRRRQRDGRREGTVVADVGLSGVGVAVSYDKYGWNESRRPTGRRIRTYHGNVKDDGT